LAASDPGPIPSLRQHSDITVLLSYVPLGSVPTRLFRL
jgi:hypothetical protein